MDMTAIMRSDLQGNPNKHHNSVAGKALPATPFGLIGQIGQVKGRRQALLNEIVEQPECKSTNRHQELRRSLIQKQRAGQKADEIVVADAEFSAHELLEFGDEDFVLRCAKNDTFCRAALKQRRGDRGRACSRREVIRAMPKTWQNRVIAASEPDACCEFVILEERKDKVSGKRDMKAVTIKVKIWNDVRVNDTTIRECVKKGFKPEQIKRLRDKRLRVLVFEDPDFDTPWMLVTTLVEVEPVIIYQIYKDRWPVEGVPSVAKTILGGHRLFVHADDHPKRLPELILLAGNILAVLAGAHEPTPTGFWDKQPKATAGRLRRLLSKVGVDCFEANFAQLCKKQSVTAHLAAARLAKRGPSLATTA